MRFVISRKSTHAAKSWSASSRPSTPWFFLGTFSRSVQPMSSESPAPARGKKSVALSGVVAANTAICTVGRTGNDLHYRGYDILEVAEACEFEEIAYLLVHERLPTSAELSAYRQKLKSLRRLPEQLLDVLEAIPASAHP